MAFRQLTAFRRLILAAGIAATATFAHADGVVQKLITPADKARLEKYDATRTDALQAAKAGAARDVAVLDAIAASKPLSFSDFDMTGSWQCRTIKAGGLGPLVVYGWFKCKVTDDGSGWMLEKISGSQRTKGRFYTDSDTRLIYLGSGFVAGEKPKAYGRGPDTDQVGYAFRSGPAEWRIELPAPRYESKLDIIEFRR
ncbi:uncharacterized protein DUF4893 [Aminobacter aminovorans]|uniref:DUF4893 domain-containing protein n=1 Tax=Aminobacter aminovorans TaxID=83263 RepID=A0A380WL84_AMIAI|nr:DUF4893 domain-containing protein [Aminobacter aminovorans]TCS28093.1 uncharacterized protein DUF4893 [Aminobacter aminovorans]SUU89495.1 Uncharacterised protein [Aminobacter aminovorans]